MLWNSSRATLSCRRCFDSCSNRPCRDETHRAAKDDSFDLADQWNVAADDHDKDGCYCDNYQANSVLVVNEDGDDGIDDDDGWNDVNE